ncbi:MAG: hypothetical protein AB1Z98_32580 [Nannocystaceae bacterium]
MSETSKPVAEDSGEPVAAESSGEPVAPEPAEPRQGKLQQVLVEYGVIAIIVLLSLSALTWLGFAAAFMAGFEVEGVGGTAGVAAAATAGWLLTKPIRIPLAIVLTPVVAAVWHRVRGRKPEPG